MTIKKNITMQARPFFHFTHKKRQGHPFFPPNTLAHRVANLHVKNMSKRQTREGSSSSNRFKFKLDHFKSNGKWWFNS